VTILSVDLAQKRYADVGVCSLRVAGRGIEVTPVRLAELGLSGAPAPDALAEAIGKLAEQVDARLVLVDGPQAWKDPANGLLHSRVCERRLATPAKTGLPGRCKPATYAGFVTLAVDLFDELARLGWPRLPDPSALRSPGRFALESFPTSAWRSLGLAPLPAKSKTRAGVVEARLAELHRLFPLSVSRPGGLTHDELQALVAGLAGLAVEGYEACGVALAGVPPFELEGSRREGFIVVPVRGAAGVAAFLSRV
jgi:hypothetical protein